MPAAHQRTRPGVVVREASFAWTIQRSPFNIEHFDHATVPSHNDRPSSLEEVECPGFLILKSNLQGRRERLILLELRVESLREDA